MNKLGIAILAVIAVAVIGASAAGIDLDFGDDDTADVVCHGNGGKMSDGSGTYSFDYGIEPLCAFEKEGMSFYKWNTKSDGTGTFYGDGAADAVKLADDGVKDLYAVWAYRLSTSIASFSVDGQSITSVLVNGKGSFISEAQYADFGAFLDPAVKKARLGFATSEKGVEWSYVDGEYKGVGDKYVFTVEIEEASGAENITPVYGDKNGLFAIDFDYSGNVFMKISTSVMKNTSATKP